MRLVRKLLAGFWLKLKALETPQDMWLNIVYDYLPVLS